MAPGPSAASAALTGGRRRHRGRGWSYRKKPQKPQPCPGPAPCSSSPPARPPAEAPAVFPPGAEVEVRVDDGFFHGSWFEGTVEDFAPARGGRSPGRYTVTYAHLLADDDGGALAERFAPANVRPRPPPPPPGSPPRFLLHDIVEALRDGGWWSGIVVAAAAASVTVALPITREVIPFVPHLVRPRRDYVGGEWVPSPAAVAIHPNHPIWGYGVGDKVEVEREHGIYKRAWFPAVVAKVIDGLSYIVEYLDKEVGNGGAEKATEYVHCRYIRPAEEHSPLEKEFWLGLGTPVEAYCDGAWSPGTVCRVVGDGEYEVSVDGREEKQLLTKVVELLKPRYSWDGNCWSIVKPKRRQSASRKRPRSPVKIALRDDTHVPDIEYSSTKKSSIEQQQQEVTLAESLEHSSVSEMDTPLSTVNKSQGNNHSPLTSCSPLYGHSTTPRKAALDNVQNQLEGKRKHPFKVYVSKKAAGKKRHGFIGPHSSRSSLDSRSTGQERRINKIAGSLNESSLTLESTKPSNRTLEDMLNQTEVLHQKPLAMMPSGVESVCDVLDIHGSQLDIGLTATTVCQARRTASVHAYNIGTRVPFNKSSRLWSIIEEMDVFKEFPQRPHFLPLQQHVPGRREGMAIGLMVSFAHLVENIRKLGIADSDASFEEKNSILSELKANGFSVQPLQNWLHKLMKVKYEHEKHLEEKYAVDAQKLGTMTSLSQNNSLLYQIDESMVKLELELEDLRQKGILIDKRKEHDEVELERLNEVASSVQRVLDVDKRQFQSIVEEMQQKKLT